MFRLATPRSAHFEQPRAGRICGSPSHAEAEFVLMISPARAAPVGANAERTPVRPRWLVAVPSEPSGKRRGRGASTDYRDLPTSSTPHITWTLLASPFLRRRRLLP